jgi:hypothetical protein
LLRGQGFLWYMVLMRAQIHINMLYICSKIDYPSDPHEMSELRKEVQLDENDENILSTYGAYCKLLSNATCEVGVSPTTRQTGYLVPSPSERERDRELLCYVWQTIAGPISHYLNNPSLAY